MKLFMFYIGGDCGNSNIELHDVRFSIGESPEDCYEDLRSQWWGEPASLHLDCWGEVEQADGFDVSLSEQPLPDGADKLFFINLGGYSSTEFAELHRNVLIVASDAAAAKSKALTSIQAWSLPHKDNLFEVEKAVNVSAALAGLGYSLRLERASTAKPFKFTCNYVPIG